MRSDGSQTLEVLVYVKMSKTAMKGMYGSLYVKYLRPHFITNVQLVAFMEPNGLIKDQIITQYIVFCWHAEFT